MEENCKIIIKQISNDFEKINVEAFLNKIHEAKEVNECYEISKEFCDVINDTKKDTLSYISQELESLMKVKSEINSNVKTINNDINQFINNIKGIINQSKFKLKNLTSNTNDLNSNLNLISGNLEKKKYSLASSRVEKLFQLKNTMTLNIKSLESLNQKILEQIKNEQINNKKAMSSTISRPRQNRTPSPFRPQVKSMHNKSLTMSKLYVNNRSKPKRDLSVSSFNLKNKRTYSNLRDNSLNADRRNKNDNYMKENEELKRKLVIQKQVNERLRKEIDKYKRKSNGNTVNIASKTFNPKDNITNVSSVNNTNLKNMSLNLNQNVLKFNEKINKISDLMFSLTFSINSLQNKKEISLLLEPEFTSVKKNLLSVTTEISELKSYLLKISLDNENNNTINNTNLNSNNNGFSQLLEPDDDSSINQIDDLKKENFNLQTSIDSFKSQIISLTQKLSNEQKSKENLEKSLSNIKIKNDELLEQMYKMGQGNKSISNFNRDEDTCLKDTSTMSNSEKTSLKEQLRLTEKKYLELKGMYDSNIESKNLIENLLKKNLEDTKSTYEQKISKLKKKLEDKDKEMNKLKEYYDNEEMNMINKIKEDNIENIQKLKNLYENKIMTISEQGSGANQNNFSKMEENYIKQIEKLNNELSKIKTERDMENSNNLSLNSFKEPWDEKKEKELKRQIEDLQSELKSYEKIKEKNKLLEEENKNLENKIKELKATIDENFETARENTTKNMNEIISLQDQILKCKTSESKAKDELLNIKHENIKCKNDIKIYTNEINELKSLNEKYLKEINDLKTEKNDKNNDINKDEIDALRKENNNYVTEINKLKSNINALNLEKNNSDMELNKIKENYKKIKMNLDLDLANSDKLKNNITLLTIEKEKLESKNKELTNKLAKKDKEIITLITSNTKQKNKTDEEFKNQTERLKSEVENRKKMNDDYKSQISELKKKIFEMQNSEENDINNESIKDIKERNSVFSINHSTDLNIFSSRNLPVFLEKKFTNLVSKQTITLFIESKYKPRMTPRSTPRGTPRSNRGTPSLAKKTEKKTSGEIKDVEEDDSEEYYDDDETDEEFNEKMKKLNEKNPNDSEQMKFYKKENRKMLYRLEDALAENDELQKKLIKIEEIVVKKQNELYSELKKGFEILINDFNLTNKNRDILNSFLKLMNFSDEEINNLISKKQKGLLGFFK